ncbi:MAG: NADH-quinone oxidoreductase subunit NuoE [Litorimonas sp.]
MSARRLAPASAQPVNASLSAAAKSGILEWTKKYPEGRQRSALIPALWIAQKDANGWLPEAILREVGDMLGMAYIRVFEVATFYTMYNLAPVGKFHIQLCGTTPCWLRGSDALKDVLARRVGPQNSVSEDGNFSWLEVECLGACANAPMMQVSTDVDEDPYYEDLTAESLEAILDDFAAGKTPDRGPQNGRINSAPEGGPQTLNSADLYKKARKLTKLPNQNVKATLHRHADESKGVIATIAEALNKPKNSGRDVHPDPKEKRATVEGAAPRASESKPFAAKPKRATMSASKKTAQPKVLYTDGPTDGAPDDLKKIKGIGPKFESDLNAKGVFYYRQIAAWKSKDVKAVEAVMEKFPGRITRDEWVTQAKALAKAAS